MPSPPEGSADRTWALVATVMLLLLGFALRLVLLTGPVGSDDTNYFVFSQKLAHLEHFDRLHHHGGRLAFLALVGVPAALFDSIYFGSFVNVLFYLARDVVVVWFVCRQLGHTSAAIAAGFLSLNAISMAYAGTLVPDGVLSFAMVGSVIVAMQAASWAGRRRLSWLLGSGMIAACGYSAKDTGILIVPCVLLVIFLARPLRSFKPIEFVSGAVAFLVGFGSVAVAEMFAYYLLSGDPLYRLHAISSTHNANGDVFEAGSLYEFVKSGNWNLRIITGPTSASMPVLAVAVLAWMFALHARAQLRLFTVIGAALSVYLTFGSSSLTRLIALPVQDRYFEVVVPFVAVSLASAWALFQKSAMGLEPVARRVLLVVTGLFVFNMPGALFNSGEIGASGIARNTAIAVRSIQATNPSAAIVLARPLHFAVQTFLEPHEFKSLKTFEGSVPEMPGYYIPHPWRPVRSEPPVSLSIDKLPVFMTVSQDHRFARYLPHRSDGRDVVVRLCDRSAGCPAGRN